MSSRTVIVEEFNKGASAERLSLEFSILSMFLKKQFCLLQILISIYISFMVLHVSVFIIVI